MYTFTGPAIACLTAVLLTLLLTALAFSRRETLRELRWTLALPVLRGGVKYLLVGIAILLAAGTPLALLLWAAGIWNMMDAA